MKLYKFEQQSNNPIAPSWCYFIGECQIFDKFECEEIKSLLLLKEKNILEETKHKIKNDGGTGLGNSSITSAYMHYNILEWDYRFVAKLKEELKKNINQYLTVYDHSLKNYYIKSWFNVMKKNQQIKKHHHADHQDTFLGAHLTICTKNTSTFYEHPFTGQNFEIKNQPGYLIIFPNWIKHWTNEYLGEDVRVSIAMDITYEKALKNIPEYPGKEYVKHYILN